MLERQSVIDNLKVTIQSLKKRAAGDSFDLNREIQALENKMEEMEKEIWNHLEPWDRVFLARHSKRFTAHDLVNEIFDDFMELHGDRSFGDDPAIIGGIACCNGVPVTVIAEQKGRNVQENLKRNFGMPNPEGYRKSLRLMKQAEKFHRPIIAFVDTPGAFCGIGAEERGQGEAIARNLMEMSALKVPVLAVVIGEGGSGGALALAVGNEVWMFENAIYSILSPEGFASILWKDSKRAKEASDIMKITAVDLYQLGIIEKIIKEPKGSTELTDDVTAGLKRDISQFLVRMSKMSEKEVYDQRYQKFRKCYSIQAGGPSGEEINYGKTIYCNNRTLL